MELTLERNGSPPTLLKTPLDLRDGLKRCLMELADALSNRVQWEDLDVVLVFPGLGADQ